MNCPTCKQPMKEVRKDTSYNLNENNKEYYRILYHCPEDDIWISTEIPKKKTK